MDTRPAAIMPAGEQLALRHAERQVGGVEDRAEQGEQERRQREGEDDGRPLTEELAQFQPPRARPRRKRGGRAPGARGRGGGGHRLRSDQVEVDILEAGPAYGQFGQFAARRTVGATSEVGVSVRTLVRAGVVQPVHGGRRRSPGHRARPGCPRRRSGRRRSPTPGRPVPRPRPGSGWSAGWWCLRRPASAPASRTGGGPRGSNPVVGSSRNTSSGSPTMPRATSSRRRWPPDRELIRLPAFSVSPTRSITVSGSRGRA